MVMTARGANTTGAGKFISARSTKQKKSPLSSQLKALKKLYRIAKVMYSMDRVHNWCNFQIRAVCSLLCMMVLKRNKKLNGETYGSSRRHAGNLHPSIAVRCGALCPNHARPWPENRDLGCRNRFNMEMILYLLRSAGSALSRLSILRAVPIGT